jgi:hypothetical protein
MIIQRVLSKHETDVLFEHTRHRRGSGIDHSKSIQSPNARYDHDRMLVSADPSGDELPKRTQTQSAGFQCTSCPKKFARADTLRAHIRQMHPDGESVNRCELEQLQHQYEDDRGSSEKTRPSGNAEEDLPFPHIDEADYMLGDDSDDSRSTDRTLSIASSGTSDIDGDEISLVDSSGEEDFVLLTDLGGGHGRKWVRKHNRS